MGYFKLYIDFLEIDVILFLYFVSDVLFEIV